MIEVTHHLCNPDDPKLCSGSRKLLEHVFPKNWPVVVITNQSGIARGYFDWESYDQDTDHFFALLGSAALPADIYANGHGSDAAPTSCRKPGTAVIQELADLQLDLTRSLLIGARLSGLEAGDRADLSWLAHVQTGHGQTERSSIQRWNSQKQLQAKGNSCFDLALLVSLLDFPFERLVILNE